MKNIFITFAVMVSALIISSSCSSDLSDFGEEAVYGSISGSVSDKTTGEPVPTVNVTLTPGGASTVTGTDGSFSFTNLDPGDYTLEISKVGYRDNMSEFYVKTGDPTTAHMLIERIPGIVTADRETLDFGDNQSLNTRSFNIVNSSYEDLAWEIEERCDWITEIKPARGTLAYGKTEGIVVVIDREKLSGGVNKAVIVIRSSQGSTQMNVTATGVERSLPRLNTMSVTEITSSSAVFNGEIISEGEPAYSERGFVYSLTSMPTVENTIAKITCPVTKDESFSYRVSGLKYNQTYYVRAYAKNKIGIAYSSNERQFVTTVTMPQVVTLDIVDVDFKNDIATFRGEIKNVGEPEYIERGFVFGTYPEPTINDNNLVVKGAGVPGTFSLKVGDLPKSTLYVRAYATSPAGTVYGEQKILTSEWIELPGAGIAVQTKDVGQGSWSSVKAMCEGSTLGGYTDWRLPTKEELMILYNNRDRIGGFQKSIYWSSTYAGSDYYGSKYYFVDFNDGDLSYWWHDHLFYGRAVRTLKK